MFEDSQKNLFRAVVEKMTNHERNLWARAGYPGLKHKETEKLKPYAAAAIRRLGLDRRWTHPITFFA